MYDFDIDGRLHVTAGASLLNLSRLIQWDSNQAAFYPVARDTFECSWRRDVDPVFGRLVCWVNFSAGAEMLARGLCLLHNIEIRWTQDVPSYPTSSMADWSAASLKNWKSGGVTPAVNYGKIGDLVDQTHRKTKLPPALPRLFKQVNATREQGELLLAAYGLLARTIRNRDAHAYVPHVRDDHVLLVTELFAGCFNALVSWLPGGPTTLNVWKCEAKQFIASL
jgi:hypothetical protein